jgi:hypothetical protein
MNIFPSENSALIKKYNVAGPRYTSYPTVPYWQADTWSVEKWKDSVKSAFKKDNKVRDLLVIGPIVGLGIFSVIFIPKFIPSFGYPIEAGGIVMLTAGLIILGISKWVNKTYRISDGDFL